MASITWEVKQRDLSVEDLIRRIKPLATIERDGLTTLHPFNERRTILRALDAKARGGRNGEDLPHLCVEMGFTVSELNGTETITQEQALDWSKTVMQWVESRFPTIQLSIANLHRFEWGAFIHLVAIPMSEGTQKLGWWEVTIESYLNLTGDVRPARINREVTREMFIVLVDNMWLECGVPYGFEKGTLGGWKRPDPAIRWFRRSIEFH